MMELNETLRTTGSVREFSPQPIDDDIIFKILDDARFAPSGGNRQAWHVIVVKGPHQREAVATAYLDAWHDYVAHVLAGVVPFSPLASDADRTSADAQRAAAIARSKPGGFAETIAGVPAMLVVTARIAELAATDRDLDRYHLVGGASIYPFVWNILLSARSHDLGGVITTVATRNEPMLRDALRLPFDVAVAAVVVLGHPLQRHTKLTRKPVQEFASVDTFDGDALTP
jgi:nitroreductase